MLCFLTLHCHLNVALKLGLLEDGIRPEKLLHLRIAFPRCHCVVYCLDSRDRFFSSEPDQSDECFSRLLDEDARGTGVSASFFWLEVLKNLKRKNLNLLSSPFNAYRS